MRWLWIAALLLAGCRSSASPYEIANERVHDGVTQGFATSNDGEARPLQVRFNPAPCECPPFEVFAFGRWMRVFVETDAPPFDTLRSEGSLAIVTVVATLDPKPKPAPNGVLYRTLR